MKWVLAECSRKEVCHGTIGHRSSVLIGLAAMVKAQRLRKVVGGMSGVVGTKW